MSTFSDLVGMLLDVVAAFPAFPLRASEECARCGTDDVTLWRERFGEKE